MRCARKQGAAGAGRERNWQDATKQDWSEEYRPHHQRQGGGGAGRGHCPHQPLFQPPHRGHPHHRPQARPALPARGGFEQRDGQRQHALLPTASSTAWAPRSASAPTSSTRAGRWASRGPPRSRRTWCWARAKRALTARRYTQAFACIDAGRPQSIIPLKNHHHRRGRVGERGGQPGVRAQRHHRHRHQCARLRDLERALTCAAWWAAASIRRCSPKPVHGHRFAHCLCGEDETNLVCCKVAQRL